MKRSKVSLSALLATALCLTPVTRPAWADDGPTNPPSADKPVADKPSDEPAPLPDDFDKQPAGPVQSEEDEDKAGTDRVPAGTPPVGASRGGPEPAEVATPTQDDENKLPAAGDGKATGEPKELKPDDESAVPMTTPMEETLSPEATELRDRIRKCLLAYYQDPISVNDYSPWGIMHVMIAYGVDTEIYSGDRKVNAIGWLCYNGTCRGQKLMYLDNGKIRLRIGPGVQGHSGQFLSMLAQSRVRTDFPIKVDGRDFTVADLIESEKETCRSKTELTFKLIGLSHYLKTDEKWKSDIGEEWSIPRLIKEELAQPVVGSACGGTHRMTGFSYAVNKRTKLEESFDGQWLRAQKFVNDYHQYIFKLQNPDGSFSTNWFAGRGDWGEAPRRLETTGHMLEWLVCSLPKEQLDDPRVVKAASFLTDLLLEGKKQRRKWEVGPRGHGLHGLAIYAERRFGDKPGSRDIILAKQPKAEGTKSR